MVRDTTDVSIWDEDTGNSVEIDADEDMHTKAKIWDGTDEVDVVDDDGTKRLAVDVAGDVTIPSVSRSDQIVNEFDTYSTDRNKATYTVPSGKVLYCQNAWASLGDDGGFIGIEWQEDGTGFASLSINSDGTQQANVATPKNAPWGPFSAGTVIRLRREIGDSGKDWAGGWTGYLEDV